MNKKILDILKKVYEETNRGVAYAETKNAVLIGFNIALLGATTIFGESQGFFLVGHILFIILLTAAAGVSLYSFKPDTGNAKDNRAKKKKADEPLRPEAKTKKENMLFYGSAAKMSPEQYIQCLIYRYDNNESTKLEEIDSLTYDYAREIVYNGKIAMRKFDCFKIAWYIDLGAGGLGALLLIIKVIATFLAKSA